MKKIIFRTVWYGMLISTWLLGVIATDINRFICAAILFIVSIVMTIITCYANR